MKDEIKNRFSSAIKSFSHLKLPCQNNVRDLFTNEHADILRDCPWVEFSMPVYTYIEVLKTFVSLSILEAECPKEALP